MKTKHTPGPWYTHQATATDGSWVVYSDLGTVAYTPTNMRAEENAALIAAAPEMLEALSLALKGLAGPYSDGNIGLSTRDMLVKEIESAITKARGEL